jgi:hypothetical protein
MAKATYRAYQAVGGGKRDSRHDREGALRENAGCPRQDARERGAVPHGHRDGFRSGICVTASTAPSRRADGG